MNAVWRQIQAPHNQTNKKKTRSEVKDCCFGYMTTKRLSKWKYRIERHAHNISYEAEREQISQNHNHYKSCCQLFWTTFYYGKNFSHCSSFYSKTSIWWMLVDRPFFMSAENLLDKILNSIFLNMFLESIHWICICIWFHSIFKCFRYNIHSIAKRM